MKISHRALTGSIGSAFTVEETSVSASNSGRSPASEYTGTDVRRDSREEYDYAEHDPKEVGFQEEDATAAPTERQVHIEKALDRIRRAIASEKISGDKKAAQDEIRTALLQLTLAQNQPLRTNQGSPRGAPAPAEECVMIGFDTEYKAVKDDKFGLRNHILSMQIFGVCGEKSWKAIKYIDDRRMTFPEMIVWAVEEGMTQKALRRRPPKVTLVSHFSIADLSALADSPEVFREFDYCKRTFVTFRKPYSFEYYDRFRNEHSVSVTLRDPWLMCPAGSRKLEALGNYIGIPKVDITPYRIDEMDRLLREDPDLFYRYAICDPEIAVRYTEKLTELAREFLDQDSAPTTVGACAVRLTEKTWKDEQINQHSVLGTRLVKDGRGYCIVPLPIRQDYESFATNAFYGGRNETFCFGPSPVGHFVDIDLSSAYSTALACLGMPEWSKLRSAETVDDFVPGVIGFALVKFRFPAETRFPCLPVRVGAAPATEDELVTVKSGNALIFPLEGESYATAPEIYLARQLGAEIELRRGCVMPMNMACRPFVAISGAVARERGKHAKGSLMEQMIKTIGNCVFGKLAQAVHPKRVFSTRKMDMEDMAPSRITNPYLAAATTGIIRALIGEILAAVPEHRMVVSATTDGFLSDVAESEIGDLQKGPLCAMFREARSLLTEKGEIVEIKHRAQQVMSWRTRGLATLEYDDPNQLMLARAGIKTPAGDLEAQNEFIVKQFVNRRYGDAFNQFHLRNAREMYEDGGDFVGEERIIRHRMDYDFKRRPVTPQERDIRGTPHLFFTTVPLRCAAEYTRIRERWDEFYHAYQTPLTRLETWNDFCEFAAVGNVGKLQVPRKSAALYVARKMALSAYAKSEWGFERKLSNAQLAAVFSEAGYATAVHEVENAKRSKTMLYPHCVRATGEVMQFVEFLEKHFPGFRREELLDPET